MKFTKEQIDCYCVCHSPFSSCCYCEHCKGDNEVTRRYREKQLTSIYLSKRDSELFIKAIDSDKEPNEKLKEAARRFKEKYGDQSSEATA